MLGPIVRPLAKAITKSAPDLLDFKVKTPDFEIFAPKVPNLNKAVNNARKLAQPEGSTKVIEPVDVSFDIFSKFPNQDHLKNNLWKLKKIEELDTAFTTKDMTPDQSTRFKALMENVENTNEFKARVNEFEIDLKSEKVIEGLKLKNDGVLKNQRKLKSWMSEAIDGTQSATREVFKHIRNKHLNLNIYSGLDLAQKSEMETIMSALYQSPENLSKVTKSIFNKELSQEDILSYALDPANSSLDSFQYMKNLKESLKGFDDDIMIDLQNKGISIGKQNEYFVPLHIPDDVLITLGGKDSFIEEMLTRTNLSEEQAKNMARNLEQNQFDAKLSSGEIIFGEKKDIFNSLRDEIEFFKKSNGLSDDAPLLSYYLDHKKRLVKKAGLIAEFGPDPKKSFRKIVDRIRIANDGLDKAEAEKLKKLFDKQYDTLLGNVNVTSPLIESIRLGINSLTNFLTGVPMNAIVRNAYLDFNLNRSAVSSAIYNPNTNVGSTAFNIFKDIFRVIGDKFSPENRADVSKILNHFDYSNMRNSMFDNAHFFEDTLNTTQVRNFAGVNRRLQKFSDAIDKLNDWGYNTSGQNSLTDIKRVQAILDQQTYFSMLFDKFKNYDVLYKSVTELQRKQLDHLSEVYGIGKIEWNFLSELTPSSIEYRGEPIRMRTFEDIIDAPDDLIRKHKSPNQTVEGFKRDILQTYKKYIHANMQDYVPLSTISTSISKELTGASSPVRLVGSLILKFSDIAQGQWSNLIKKIHIATNGNRNDRLKVSGATTYQFSRSLGVYMGATAGIQWTKDYLAGRDMTSYRGDTEDSRLNILRLMVYSGYGGASMQIFNSLLGITEPEFAKGSYFSKLPGGSIVKTLEPFWDYSYKSFKGEATGVDKHKALSTLFRTPTFNFFATRGIFDKWLIPNLLSPRDMTDVREREERIRRRKER